MLGISLSASLSSMVSSCHTGLDNSGYSAGLLSSRPGSKRPSTNYGSSIRGDPSNQDVTSVDKELQAVVQAVVAIAMGQAVVLTVVLVLGIVILVLGYWN